MNSTFYKNGVVRMITGSFSVWVDGVTWIGDHHQETFDERKRTVVFKKCSDDPNQHMYLVLVEQHATSPCRWTEWWGSDIVSIQQEVNTNLDRLAIRSPLVQVTHDDDAYEDDDVYEYNV